MKRKFNEICWYLKYLTILILGRSVRLDADKILLVSTGRQVPALKAAMLLEDNQEVFEKIFANFDLQIMDRPEKLQQISDTISKIDSKVLKS